MPRVNLLIADDVSLGKTVEAGLIMRELLLRRRIETIVVAAPALMLLHGKTSFRRNSASPSQLSIANTCSRSTNALLLGQSVECWFAVHRVAQRSSIAVPARIHAHSDEAHHAAPSTGAAWALES